MDSTININTVIILHLFLKVLTLDTGVELICRLRSYYSNAGMFDELTSGLEYYRFVTRLSKTFDQDAEIIKSRLKETAQILFTQNNLIAGATCSKKEYKAFSEGMNRLVASLPESSSEKQVWTYEFDGKNEGLLTASKVQYVVKGFNFKKLGYEYNGKMQVLNQVLSTDWLLNRVRVMGGAYGGFSGISSDGNIYFASYRDPNLSETMDNFNNSTRFLTEFNADEKTMTRFIIGTISHFDQPRNVSDKGNEAFKHYFEKTTPEMLRAEREAILSTTAGDIRSMSTMIEGIMNQNFLCVYGNEDKIKENKSLFGNLVLATD
jgi:presequence protease